MIAASAIEADALSTAVFVLGAERGLALLERRGAAGFVLRRRNVGARWSRLPPACDHATASCPLPASSSAAIPALTGLTT